MNGGATDRVTIRGLRCTGRQGVTEEQRARPNEYLVDVALCTDLGPAAEHSYAELSGNVIDPKTGMRLGASDPRSGGVPVGY